MKYSVLCICAILIFSCQNTKKNVKDYYKMTGQVFGTFYSIIFESEGARDSILSYEVLEELDKVNNSLSPYVKTSTISNFNNSESGSEIDSMMELVVNEAFHVYKDSHGAFDITVAPLVNAWGFGFKNKDSISTALIKSLLENVGMDKVKLSDGFLSKDKPGVMLDASSIAKGFGVDVAANYLESKGVKNYLVDIGGELRAKGVNNKGVAWRVGIDKPIDDKSAANEQIQAILSFKNRGLATSGNYRNFYYKDGKKYAHTIDPHSGYPVQHSLLSASIIADDCMVADAYATACMVMGVEKSMQIIDSIPGLEGYFIYADKDGENKVTYTAGFKKYLEE